VRTLQSPPPRGAEHAAVVARATALLERVRRVATTLPAGKRMEIERRLVVVHRMLEKLGFRGTA